MKIEIHNTFNKQRFEKSNGGFVLIPSFDIFWYSCSRCTNTAISYIITFRISLFIWKFESIYHIYKTKLSAKESQKMMENLANEIAIEMLYSPYCIDSSDSLKEIKLYKYDLVELRKLIIKRLIELYDNEGLNSDDLETDEDIKFEIDYFIIKDSKHK